MMLTLKRGDGVSAKLLLVLASRMILGSEYHGAHHQILLFGGSGGLHTMGQA